MKAALAQFIFESNTFAPNLAEIDLFRKGGVFLKDEAQVRAWAAGTDSQMHGSLEVLAAAGWETAPCFTALCGSPAGRLSAACFREISGTLLDRVAAAMPFDVLILHLHGAAVADGEDDPEGYLLEKVRTDLGYRGRLVLSLDLHANFTRRMLRHADAVTAYRTFPHMDFTATGERAARLALHPGPLHPRRGQGVRPDAAGGQHPFRGAPVRPAHPRPRAGTAARRRPRHLHPAGAALDGHRRNGLLRGRHRHRRRRPLR